MVPLSIYWPQKIFLPASAAFFVFTLRTKNGISDVSKLIEEPMDHHE